MIDPAIQGRAALITGANNPHGIGAAIARALAKQGVRICLHYYRTRQTAPPETNRPGEPFYDYQQTKDAQEVLESLHALGAEAVAIEADLSNPESVCQILDHAENAFGSLEILVNNACYWEADTFLPPAENLASPHVELWTSRSPVFRPDIFDRVFAVDARAAAHLMTEFAKRHIARQASWGRVLNISTDGAYCFPGEISYGAAKIALESYSRSAATELARFGITVNTLSPGPIQTGYITPELEAHVLDSIPLRRVGRPEDIADAALFFLSEQAQWITGQTLHVGGGHHM